MTKLQNNTNVTISTTKVALAELCTLQFSFLCLHVSFHEAHPIGYNTQIYASFYYTAVNTRNLL